MRRLNASSFGNDHPVRLRSLEILFSSEAVSSFQWEDFITLMRFLLLLVPGYNVDTIHKEKYHAYKKVLFFLNQKYISVVDIMNSIFSEISRLIVFRNTHQKQNKQDEGIKKKKFHITTSLYGIPENNIFISNLIPVDPFIFLLLSSVFHLYRSSLQIFEILLQMEIHEDECEAEVWLTLVKALLSPSSSLLFQRYDVETKILLHVLIHIYYLRSDGNEKIMEEFDISPTLNTSSNTLSLSSISNPPLFSPSSPLKKLNNPYQYAITCLLGLLSIVLLSHGLPYRKRRQMTRMASVLGLNSNHREEETLFLPYGEIRDPEREAFTGENDELYSPSLTDVEYTPASTLSMIETQFLKVGGWRRDRKEEPISGGKTQGDSSRTGATKEVTQGNGKGATEEEKEKECIGEREMRNRWNPSTQLIMLLQENRTIVFFENDIPNQIMTAFFLSATSKKWFSPLIKKAVAYLLVDSVEPFATLYHYLLYYLNSSLWKKIAEEYGKENTYCSKGERHFPYLRKVGLLDSFSLSGGKSQSANFMSSGREKGEKERGERGEILVSVDSQDLRKIFLQNYILASREAQKNRLLAINCASPRNRHSYIGLANIGNTCYANSVLQVLYLTTPFLHEILSSDFVKRKVMSLWTNEKEMLESDENKTDRILRHFKKASRILTGEEERFGEERRHGDEKKHADANKAGEDTRTNEEAKNGEEKRIMTRALYDVFSLRSYKSDAKEKVSQLFDDPEKEKEFLTMELSSNNDKQTSNGEGDPSQELQDIYTPSHLHLYIDRPIHFNEHIQGITVKAIAKHPKEEGETYSSPSKSSHTSKEYKVKKSSKHIRRQHTPRKGNKEILSALRFLFVCLLTSKKPWIHPFDFLMNFPNSLKGIQFDATDFFWTICNQIGYNGDGKFHDVFDAFGFDVEYQTVCLNSCASISSPLLASPVSVSPGLSFSPVTPSAPPSPFLSPSSEKKGRCSFLKQNKEHTLALVLPLGPDGWEEKNSLAETAFSGLRGGGNEPKLPQMFASVSSKPVSGESGNLSAASNSETFSPLVVKTGHNSSGISPVAEESGVNTLTSSNQSLHRAFTEGSHPLSQSGYLYSGGVPVLREGYHPGLVRPGVTGESVNAMIGMPSPGVVPVYANMQPLSDGVSYYSLAPVPPPLCIPQNKPILAVSTITPIASPTPSVVLSQASSPSTATTTTTTTTTAAGLNCASSVLSGHVYTSGQQVYMRAQSSPTRVLETGYYSPTPYPAYATSSIPLSPPPHFPLPSSIPTFPVSSPVGYPAVKSSIPSSSASPLPGVAHYATVIPSPSFVSGSGGDSSAFNTTTYYSPLPTIVPYSSSPVSLFPSPINFFSSSLLPSSATTPLPSSVLTTCSSGATQLSASPIPSLVPATTPHPVVGTPVSTGGNYPHSPYDTSGHPIPYNGIGSQTANPSIPSVYPSVVPLSGQTSAPVFPTATSLPSEKESTLKEQHPYTSEKKMPGVVSYYDIGECHSITVSPPNELLSNQSDISPRFSPTQSHAGKSAVHFEDTHIDDGEHAKASYSKKSHVRVITNIKKDSEAVGAREVVDGKGKQEKKKRRERGLSNSSIESQASSVISFCLMEQSPTPKEVDIESSIQDTTKNDKATHLISGQEKKNNLLPIASLFDALQTPISSPQSPSVSSCGHNPAREDSSIVEAMNLLLAPELLDGYKCPKCDNGKTVYRFPVIRNIDHAFHIHLSRFQIHWSMKSPKKIKQRIQINTHFFLDTYEVRRQKTRGRNAMDCEEEAILFQKCVAIEVDKEGRRRADNFVAFDKEKSKLGREGALIKREEFALYAVILHKGDSANKGHFLTLGRRSSQCSSSLFEVFRIDQNVEELRPKNSSPQKARASEQSRTGEKDPRSQDAKLSTLQGTVPTSSIDERVREAERDKEAASERGTGSEKDKKEDTERSGVLDALWETTKDQWFVFDDEDVAAFDIRQLDERTNGTETAYICCYAKVGIFDARYSSERIIGNFDEKFVRTAENNIFFPSTFYAKKYVAGETTPHWKGFEENSMEKSKLLFNVDDLEQALWTDLHTVFDIDEMQTSRKEESKEKKNFTNSGHSGSVTKRSISPMDLEKIRQQQQELLDSFNKSKKG